MSRPIRVLVGCEFSGVVRRAFRARGFDAWSCDLLPAEDGSEYHIQGDVLAVLGQSWDLMIAHPPCTYLTVTGNKWFKPEFRDRFPNRQQDRKDAVGFFLKFVNTPVSHIAIENPVGIMSTVYRRPDCIIQPWYFGDKSVKKTCLWLKNLPPLMPTEIVEPEYKIYNSSTKVSGKSRYPMAWTSSGKGSTIERSRTFPGIAGAMADQWGNYVAALAGKGE